MKARIEQEDISAGNTDDSSAADTADPKMQITSNVKEPIVVLGVNLSSYSLSQQFLVLALGQLVAACAFALLQEQVFTIKIDDDNKYRFPGLMTVLTTFTYTVCAAVERQQKSEGRRKGSMVSYVKLSFVTLGGMYFTNWSLKYLNYATRIMFKASKVVPVMLVSVVMQGSKYSALEYFDAGLLVVGISLFVMGDSEVSPEFDMFGIFLISLGVGCDAVTANYEERHFFKEVGCSHQEVIQYSSALSTFFGVITFVASGEATEAIPFAMAKPEVFLYTCGASVMGYLSVGFVLLIIKHFGATLAEVVKSCRKIVSIMLSFMVHPKPFGRNHVLGGFFFATAVALGVRIKTIKAKAKEMLPTVN